MPLMAQSVAQSYAEILAWLLVALGAALVLGTGAALFRYRRTGLFPGQTPDDPPERRRRGTRGAMVKLGIGLFLVLWGAGTLAVTG